MTTATKTTPAGTIVTFDLGAVFGVADWNGITARARVVRHFKNGKMGVELVRDAGPWGAGKDLHVKPAQAEVVDGMI
jgi:hypothetical protein